MPERSEHARLEAFCDGVFAIAITLLILDIKVPPVASISTVAEFWKVFFGDWPMWFAFLLSFIIILVAWVNHHNSFKMIDKSSSQFTYANGFMLLTIVVMPFSAGLMSDYLQTGLEQPGITIYCFSILLHNISWIIFGWTAFHPLDLTKDEECRTIFQTAIVKNSRYAFVLYLSLCILSFWLPVLSMILMTASWIVWIITGIMLTKKSNA